MYGNFSHGPFRRVTNFVFAAALLSAPAAEALAEDNVYLGAGMNSCTEFLAGYKKDPTLTEAVYYTWALGFMTGINFAGDTFKGQDRLGVLDSISTEDQKARLLEDCRQHPSDSYMDSVLALYLAMRKIPR